MNTTSKCFITIPRKFKCSLTCPVQNKKKKIHVKAEIAQNDTDLPCINLDFNVSINTRQISVILSYFGFYMYFIFYFIHDM